MKQSVSNIFANIPEQISQELFKNIVTGDNIRIERIISKGHTAPEAGWYDQDEHEWVIVLKGAATIEFEHQAAAHLEGGSYLNIPAHARHKVSWTDPDLETVWLAIYYK